MLPADNRMATTRRSSGQREGAVRTVTRDADSPEGVDGRAIVLVAKEQRHQVLILNRWNL